MRVLHVAEKNKVAGTVSQLLSGGRCRQSNSWWVLHAPHATPCPAAPTLPVLCVLQHAASLRRRHCSVACSATYCKIYEFPFNMPGVGQVEMVFTSVGTNTGRARPFPSLAAVARCRRSPSLPALPTLAAQVDQAARCACVCNCLFHLQHKQGMYHTPPLPVHMLPPVPQVAGHLLELEFEPRVRSWHSCSPKDLYDATVNKAAPKVGAKVPVLGRGGGVCAGVNGDEARVCRVQPAPPCCYPAPDCTSTCSPAVGVACSFFLLLNFL